MQLRRRAGIASEHACDWLAGQGGPADWPAGNDWQTYSIKVYLGSTRLGRSCGLRMHRLSHDCRTHWLAGERRYPCRHSSRPLLHDGARGLQSATQHNPRETLVAGPVAGQSARTLQAGSQPQSVVSDANSNSRGGLGIESGRADSAAVELLAGRSRMTT